MAFKRTPGTVLSVIQLTIPDSVLRKCTIAPASRCAPSGPPDAAGSASAGPPWVRILRQCRRQLIAHFPAKGFRGNDFDVCCVAQDVHDQLARITVGNAKLVGTIAQICALLLGMPLFVGHPA